MDLKPRSSYPICLAPQPLDRPPRQRLPAGTCDCHFHVFDVDAPCSEPRDYDPQPASLDSWKALALTAGIDRGIVVQPSPYGRDNSVLLQALEAYPAFLRGIVVTDPEIALSELRVMHRRGVRGIRINARNSGGLHLESAVELSTRIAPLGWHINFQIGPDQLQALQELAYRLHTPFVIDHVAFIDPLRPSAEDAYTALARLLEKYPAFVKLSGLYRLSHGGGLDMLRALTLRLLDSFPDRILWGTDWPHAGLFAAMPCDVTLLDTILEWVQDPTHRQAMFVKNPQTLYWSTD